MVVISSYLVLMQCSLRAMPHVWKTQWNPRFALGVLGKSCRSGMQQVLEIGPDWSENRHQVVESFPGIGPIELQRGISPGRFCISSVQTLLSISGTFRKRHTAQRLHDSASPGDLFWTVSCRGRTSIRHVETWTPDSIGAPPDARKVRRYGSL